MPEFVLVIIVALAGALAGYFVRGVQTGPRRSGQRVATNPASSQPTVNPPETTTQTRVPQTPAPAGTEADSDFPVLHVAREVLEVVDHVGNPELARRLIEAVLLLPDVSAIRPVPGEEFEPLVHEWAGHRITEQQTQWDTIAEILVPGAITAEQALLRPAHVIVFEPPEEP